MFTVNYCSNLLRPMIICYFYCIGAPLGPADLAATKINFGFNGNEVVIYLFSEMMLLMFFSDVCSPRGSASILQ